MGPFEYPKDEDYGQVVSLAPYKLDDGSFYHGQWTREGKQPHGRGVRVWDSGSRYEGQFNHGLMEGLGRIINEIGDIYEGEWK